MQHLSFKIPILRIPYSSRVELYIKREDLTHPEISGNKYWKLFYNIRKYRERQVAEPLLVTFGGAFSNHIAATAAVGREMGMKTLGIIRGDELINKWQTNPTLAKAFEDGMSFEFVTREAYRDKQKLSEIFQENFPDALIIPEGGSSSLAVEGVQFMLDERTKEFDYLCTAVGTGGTLAGLSKFAEAHQTALGFKAVNDDTEPRIANWSGRNNFQVFDASGRGYGKVTDELISFINDFSQRFGVQLDPCYTGKMMKMLTEKIDESFFPEGAKILAFHTGGLQGIDGMNEQRAQKGKPIIIKI